jgi:hypothetical protein
MGGRSSSILSYGGRKSKGNAKDRNKAEARQKGISDQYYTVLRIRIRDPVPF